MAHIRPQDLHSKLNRVAVKAARSNLLDAVQQSKEPDFTELLHLDLSEKYILIDARPALSSDKQAAENLRRSCIFLRNKLKHLVLPERDRNPDWNRFQASYCQCLPGVEQLLERVGFNRDGQSFVTTPNNLSQEALADALVDLYLLSEELRLCINNQHPLKDRLLAGGDAGVLGEPRGGANYRDAPQQAHGLAPRGQRVSALQEILLNAGACDLCSDLAASVLCLEDPGCSKRRLCQSCDAKWHGHPDRKNHRRKPMPGAAVGMGMLGAHATPSVSGVRKVVSSSSNQQSGLGGSGFFRPQPAVMAAAEAARMAARQQRQQQQEFQYQLNLPQNQPEPQAPRQVPVQPQRRVPLQPQPQEPAQAISDADERIAELQEYMMSILPRDNIPLARGDDATALPSDIHRLPLKNFGDEDQYYDCPEPEPMPEPVTPRPPQPKPRQSRGQSILPHIPQPIAIRTPPPFAQQPAFVAQSETLDETNSWICPHPNCNVCNLISDTKLLKGDRVMCIACCKTSDAPENVKNTKLTEQAPPQPPPQPQVKKEPVARQEEPQVPPGQWQCFSCTLFNPVRSPKCDVCENPRYGLQQQQHQQQNQQQQPQQHQQMRLREHVEDDKIQIIRLGSPKAEANANKNLLEIIIEIESTGADGRLVHLFVANAVSAALSKTGPAPSVGGYQAWEVGKWPRIIEQVSQEVAKEFPVGGVRPTMDDVCAAVLENPSDLTNAAFVCTQRHRAKVAWIAENCPELLDQLGIFTQNNLQEGMAKVFEAQNARTFNDFKKFLYCAESKQKPNHRGMNDSEGTMFCLIGEFGLRSVRDAKTLYQLLKVEELNDYNVHDLAEVAEHCVDKPDYVDFVKMFMDAECSICYGKNLKNRLISMPSCQCELCFECFRNFVTTTLRSNEHITKLHCCNCEIPDGSDIEALESHFSMLLNQIRAFRHKEIRFEMQDIELLEKKITEWSLIRDPNFRWCSHCDTGVVLDPIMLRKEFQCPDCHSFTCKDCKKPWADQHKDLTCEQYRQWLEDNDPNFQERGVGHFLEQNGIECPNCHFQYALAKGGCMHFICRQQACRYEFCAGCKGRFEKVVGHGLKCEHPRDCLSYLRDFDVKRLQDLLRNHQVEFQADVENDVTNCPVMEQKEKVGKNLVDEACGIEVKPKQANLCEKHYKEYLVSLINKHKLDPVEVMDEGELNGVCARHKIDRSQLRGNLDAIRALIIQKVPLVK